MRFVSWTPIASPCTGAILQRDFRTALFAFSWISFIESTGSAGDSMQISLEKSRFALFSTQTSMS
jgi:hypothetical protein